MIEADGARFKAALAVLSIAHQRTVSQPLADVYWKALKDVPIDLVEAAAEWAVKNLHGFPRPAALRKAADAVQMERAQQGKLLPAGADEHPEGDVCPACEGTEGWVYYHCDGAADADCPHRRRFPHVEEHNPHDYVRRCGKCAAQRRAKRPKRFGPKERARYRKGDDE